MPISAYHTAYVSIEHVMFLHALTGFASYAPLIAIATLSFSQHFAQMLFYAFLLKGVVGLVFQPRFLSSNKFLMGLLELDER